MTSNIENNNINSIFARLSEVKATDYPIRTRFAPSPNGYLHHGHALSAYYNYELARAYGGEYLLRIEDIDGGRSRSEYSAMIMRDLTWLGLYWDKEPIYQSERINRYKAAFDILRDKGLLYPCFCSRQDIVKAVTNTPVKHGPDGVHYPGTCRTIKSDIADKRRITQAHAWRLDMQKTLQDVPLLFWYDMEHGEQTADPALFGDIVLWRKDAPASYHLAATLDDASDRISHVIRGMDLFAYTALHRLLQHILTLAVPQYWHHPLLLDKEGDKLSKSKRSDSLYMLRKQGITALSILNVCKKG